MGQQYRIKRQIDSRALTENGVVTFDVPRGYDIESFHFRVSGTANITTAGAAVRALAPTQLIKRVELIADGKNTIASIPGWALRFNLGRSQYGYTVPPTGFAIAAYNVEFNGFLDQALIDGMRPKDSNLRTRGMQLLQLRITTGAATDLLTGTPAGSMTAFNLETSTIETVELSDEKGALSPILYMQKRSYQDIALTASNANQQIILPVGNALRGVILMATISGEPSDAVINQVQLASGVDVRAKLSAVALKRMNSMDYEAQGILSNTTLASSSSQLPTGLYAIDLMKNGPNDVQVTNAWDLSQASEAKLILDVTGSATTQLTVVTQEFLR